MSGIYHGDEWREERVEKREGLTRAQEQARIDHEYGAGRMTQHEWSQAFDKLSDSGKWDASGRIN